MKRLILSAILILSLISCKEKYKPKDIYEEKFVKEYVQTDFGNPKDFIEITKAEYDTITNKEALELLELYNKIYFLFDSTTQEELDNLSKEAKDMKGIIHITFKVRMKYDGEVIVNTFFGSYNLNTDECIFGDNEEDYHIMPDVYHDLLRFSKDFLKGSIIKETNYFSI